MYNVKFANVFIGVQATNGCFNASVNGLVIQNVSVGTGTGIILDDVTDWYISNTLINNTGGSLGLVGINVISTGALWMDNVDVFYHANGLKLSPNTTGKYIEWVFLDNCAFDTCSSNGILMDMNTVDGTSRLRGISLQNCWTASNTGAGVLIQRTSGTAALKGIVFDNHKSFANGTHGISVTDILAADIQVTNSQICGNSTATSNTSDGINIAAGISNLRFSNNIIGTWAGITNNQRYGIVIAAGASDNIVCTGNSILANTTGAVSNGATGTHQVWHNNNGGSNRMQGDFSNATASARNMFQSSTINGSTQLFAIPNGTSTTGVMGVTDNSDADNAAFCYIRADSASTSLRATKQGTGSFKELLFYTSDTARAKIPVDGGFALVDGVTPPATNVGYAVLYVDVADGDLKVKFGDGTVKTIVIDT